MRIRHTILLLLSPRVGEGGYNENHEHFEELTNI